MRVVFIVALAALGACSARQEEPEGGVSATVGDWSATLRAQNSSGVNGSSSAQSALAATAARISIDGAASGAQHPWHIHRGTCGSGGSIVGAAGDYPVLTVGTAGTASATATVGAPLDENERYHVNVHQSAAQMNVIISCGELRN